MEWDWILLRVTDTEIYFLNSFFASLTERKAQF